MLDDDKVIGRLILLIVFPLAVTVGTKVFLIVASVITIIVATIFIIYPKAYVKYIEILAVSSEKKEQSAANRVFSMIYAYLIAAIMLWQGLSMSWDENKSYGAGAALVVILMLLVIFFIDKYVVSIEGPKANPILFIIVYTGLTGLFVIGFFIYAVYTTQPNDLRP